jgi:hypothetical protein
MERKSTLFKTLTCFTIAVLTSATVPHSLCDAGSLPPREVKMMDDLSYALTTKLDTMIGATCRENGLEMVPEGASNVLVSGATVTLVPLTSTNSHLATPKAIQQSIQSLVYINHEQLGHFLVFLEITQNQKDEAPSSIKMIFPSGRGIVIEMNPFSLYQVDASTTGFSLQEYDDLENTIIISGACETMRIIEVVLTAACAIFVNPTLCIVAAVMEGIYQLLCD